MTEQKKSIKKLAAFFVLLALTFARTSLAQAQKQATIPRIGILYASASPDANLDIFLQELRALGYIDGKTVVIEYRFAAGKQIVFRNSQQNWCG